MSLQLTRGGYGKSTKPNGLTVTSETSADDLKSVIDFIKNLRHLEKVDIVGAFIWRNGCGMPCSKISRIYRKNCINKRSI
jgi:hypothetical protein